jgi:HEPN domain-containing protein
MSALQHDAQKWLEKSRNDLLSAQILIANTPAILDTACFHCQQAAEKALKAFLVFKETAFEKSHNLVYLLDLCAIHQREFESLLPQAQLLSPYSVEVRYPGDAIAPPPGEAQEALTAATTIWNFVLAQLPTDFHPTGLSA